MACSAAYERDWIFDALMVLWFLLLVPWFFVWALFGLAFDGGSIFVAYLLVCSVWSYPVSVVLAAVLRDRKPILVFLPFVNGLGFLLAAFINVVKHY